MALIANLVPGVDPFVGDHVFVYGTLRRGFINNEATIAFRAGASFVSMGTLTGTMYHTGWYPAWVEDGPGCVTGEVWRIEEKGIMHLLDDYEGLFDDDPDEYERVRRTVETEHGPIEAWAYLYTDRVDPAQLIASGDWADAFGAFD
ncbi:gamma-glutamylcyclotransferase (GGCT)/AIG2-like uncharacterized protein YtfP [Palleronia aestuarii]|uniref:Gamma-glutamylcyclotransferase (GGCT)/AIG2-like uncharacterized protein YtfP n=1 Tax=Palleronia aestuarii TaxID=568105 RepID=A0A2W7NID2_9RHOB|nr:gamma-glutamylcyclotransferase family protein [Palleronia aestuarii]PZX19630.1 gamma-glutamylcyclotransferase (GGCT)/AIG2-like uncharacterized protein YtfP [Palleronia aestuarii]